MKRYWPLIVVVIMSILGASVLLHANLNRGFMELMINFAGFFFLYLSTLKFWDLKGFSEGFRQYDLLAQKSKGYSYLYPFLELLIALGFLGHFFIVGVAFFTAILMIFGVLGVFNALLQKKELKCACMGTKLDLPLTTVSVVENIGMGVMSILIIIYTL